MSNKITELAYLRNQLASANFGMADIVEQHLSQFGPVKENELMVQRLRLALNEDRPLTGADASFYIHEVNEATQMSQGLNYTTTHGAALTKYAVSPYRVYHSDVIQELNSLEAWLL